MHAAIDAVLSLKAEHGLKTDQVRGVEIETYGVAKKQCGSEAWPTSPNAAQFSMRYAVAVALTDGQALVKQFSIKRLEDKELQLKAPPVEIRATKEFDEKYPSEWGCRIHLSLETGTTLMKTVTFPKGDPENPLTYKELREKFFSLAEGSAPQGRIRTLADMIENLDHVANVRDLPL
jgi:2-methylcitrate dehydratase PrpD